MLYGDEKINQIARSVLPATRRRARTARKEKQQWNQSTRARMNRDLHYATHTGMTAEAAIEAWDENPSMWLDAYSPHERYLQRDIIRDRRLADNLGPIRSWTRAKAAEFDDPADLIEDLSDKLPQTLAGRHALSHMKTEFGPDRFDRPGWAARNKWLRAVRYAAAVEKLALVVDYSLAKLNCEVRKTNYRTLRCSQRTWSFQKPTDPKYRWQQAYRTCGGFIALTPENRYSPKVTCPACGYGIKNRNIQPVSCPADIPRFIASLGTERDIVHWIDAEYERLG